LSSFNSIFFSPLKNTIAGASGAHLFGDIGDAGVKVEI
jgi:hypothetical protein